MQFIKKAVLDSIVGAGFGRQDLSNVITKVDDVPRPISARAAQVPCKNEVHQWREQSLSTVGTGAGSYPEGARPNTIGKAPVPAQNVTCRIGYAAQVTDEMTAVWFGGGEQWELDDAIARRRLASALDFEVLMATENVLNEIEWMHLAGNSANPQGVGVFPGGQTDGLLVWALAHGNVGSGGTSGAPINITLAMLQSLARVIAKQYPSFRPDTLLVPAEFRSDINTFVGSAANPIVRIVNGANGTTGMVAGNTVTAIDLGNGFILDVETEPYLSPSRNTTLTNPAVIMYARRAVSQANLIKLGTKQLAVVDTSVTKIVTCTIAQEHRNPAHVGVITNLQSAIA